MNIWDENKDRYRKVYVPENMLNSLRRFWNEREDKKSPKFFEMSTKLLNGKFSVELKSY